MDILSDFSEGHMCSAKKKFEVATTHQCVSFLSLFFGSKKRLPQPFEKCSSQSTAQEVMQGRISKGLPQ
jgi:hypothetical protein